MFILCIDEAKLKTVTVTPETISTLTAAVTTVVDIVPVETLYSTSCPDAEINGAFSVQAIEPGLVPHAASAAGDSARTTSATLSSPSVNPQLPKPSNAPSSVQTPPVMTPNAKSVPTSSSSTAVTTGPVTNDTGGLSGERTQASKSFPRMAFAGIGLGLTAAFILGLACLWWRRRRNVRLLGQHAYIEEGGNRKTTTSLWSIKESAKGQAVAGRPSIDGLSREGIPTLQKGWDSASVPVWPGGMRFDVSCLCFNA
jgi:hypothetical protein